MNLQHYGWDCSREQSFPEFRASGLVPGRVIRTERGGYEVACGLGIIKSACARSSLFVALGDWVALNPREGWILDVIPRVNHLTRLAPEDRGGVQILAANLEAVAIVMGLDGDFNLRRMERYLALIDATGARPYVVLNKRDICTEPEWRMAQAERLARGATVLCLSAIEDDIPAVFDALIRPGETLVLVGSSGAGKSTLVNALMGSEVQRTNEVRTQDQRGRHTTSSRRLLLTPGGWLVADLPGLRLVGIPDPDDVDKPDPRRDPVEKKRRERLGSLAAREFRRLTEKW